MSAAFTGALWGEGAAALPVQPAAGFGTYELAFLAGVSVSTVGLDARLALAAALAVHLVWFLASLGVGLVAWGTSFFARARADTPKTHSLS
jgi:uncharacterized membrane protein YbhN (UPF0104 family)